MSPRAGNGGETPAIDSAFALPERLIQLVARFRPDADGVGETALNLANVLWRDHGIRSDFFINDPPRAEHVLEIPTSFPHTVRNLNRGGAEAFNDALAGLTEASNHPRILLLHYASYGYSRHGTPFWLPQAIRRFVDGGGRLLTLFHELYALPRFPSRTLLTSALQRRIFRRLLALSQAAFTSSDDFLATIARNNVANRPVSLIGICSSAGEPEQIAPLAARTRRLVVFGRFPTRKQLYAHRLADISRIADHLGLTEIADIGAIDEPQWMEANVSAPLGSLLRSYGALDVDAASRLLSGSIAGALAYPISLLGKSSVVAAYQAHAMSVLLFPHADRPEPHPPGGWALNAEELLAFPPQSPALFDRLQLAASAGHAQYQCHRSARSMADTILPALRLASPTLSSSRLSEVRP